MGQLIDSLVHRGADKYLDMDVRAGSRVGDCESSDDGCDNSTCLSSDTASESSEYVPAQLQCLVWHSDQGVTSSGDHGKAVLHWCL
jgi:hypothetical protein